MWERAARAATVTLMMGAGGYAHLKVAAAHNLVAVLLQGVEDDDTLFDALHVEVVDHLHVLVEQRGERRRHVLGSRA